MTTSRGRLLMFGRPLLDVPVRAGSPRASFR
jgi:hypothetical protein